ncbi:vanadium-dependent haloperoxidase [Nocardioides renjunii]|uniref:vanadium-dependent haloperoxidase n=1 Tax=Nocardioides renjunii TaxID=3095075 RepID=UPI002AFE8224|nr:vanadium-dependent haloperoxidase [Nocardioides sp. S-34]WQQ22054.1 vanadium-dependent haloperoxidase [Nocardioides sp. S-34]
MNLHRPRLAVVSTVVLAGSLLAAPAATSGTPTRDRHPASTESAQVVLDWQRTAFATVYPANPVPVGVPLLGYTSTAMHDAVRWSTWRHDSSETAAVAAAAHAVLVHYVPAAAGALDARLAATLTDVPDGAAEDRGVRIGEKVAARLIEDRADDGYGDPTVHYTLPPGIGTWQPVAPATDMLGAWLGSMDPLVVRRLARVDGPDKLTSDDYATDYDEVRLLGSATSTIRTSAQTETARFFSANSATMVGDALVRYLEGHPVSLEETAWTFAAMHGAMTDSIIRCWQLKRDIGFWRPIEAVAAAAADGNPDTRPEAGWTPLLSPTPPYSDYVSGHGCVTSPQVEVIRARFGETVPLELRSSVAPTTPRTYATLGALEHDALGSRIWGGLHFRDAMTDAYAIGRRTARAVMQALE